MSTRSSVFLWLLPLAFLVHDGEEILTMPAWFARNQATLASIASLGPLPARVIDNLSTTTGEVAMAVGFELVFMLGATILMIRKPEWCASYFSYGALLGALALHVVTHVGQAVVFGGYTPGVISAVIVVIPISVYLYRRLFEAGWLTRRRAVISAGVGVLLVLPMVVTAHYLGRLLG